MITHPVDAIDAQEWSPAHQAPDVEREAIEGLLTEKSLVMLFPTPAPVADPEAIEARFTAHTYLPDDRFRVAPNACRVTRWREPTCRGHRLRYVARTRVWR
jgi:hypothetical protein